MIARIIDLGSQPYRATLEIQRELHARVSAGRTPETWIFVEHPPVITLGRNARIDNVLLSNERLAALGIDVVPVERGGDVTYHGPGQLVVYPIRRLERFREVVPLVRNLEEAVIRACASFSVRGERWTEHAGVWVGSNQLCAVGLAVKAMTSLHGIALNVTTDLTYDRAINPCGLTGYGITSLERESRSRIQMPDAKEAIRRAIAQTFHLQFEELAQAS